MQNIFNKFKIELILDSVQRVKMDDATYFSKEYSDYISNSKLGLLNPAQGGSPQKFLEGFKSFGQSLSLVLGSAVHQLKLEPEIYELSDVVKLSGKIGKLYENYVSYRNRNFSIEKSLILGALDADYYTNVINNYTGIGLPTQLKSAIKKLLPYHLSPKPKHTSTGKELIYLDSLMRERCINCVNSLNNNKDIQKVLSVKESYCEDVIMCNAKVSFPSNFDDDNSEMLQTIVKIKIKIDNWTIDHDKKIFTLNDLKTTGKPIQYFMGYNEIELGFMGSEKEVFKPGSWQIFHYNRQAGMYGWLLKEYINKEYGPGYSMTCNFLVVETIGSFYSKSFNVSSEEMISGFNEFSELLKRAAYHQVKGYENILEFEKSTLDLDISL